MREMVENSAMAELFSQNDAHAQQVKYCDGQAVFEPKDRASAFFVVESGEIRLFEVTAHGPRRLVDILGSGQCFGFASLGRISSYETLALSVGDSTVRVTSVNQFRKRILGEGELALKLIETMARQLHQAWNEAGDLAFEDCRCRLIKTLLRFKDCPAATDVPGGIELRITHAELAQAVGVARETVSLSLTELRREKLVQTGRNRIFYHPDQLRQFCAGADPGPRRPNARLALQPACR
jgi:CRP/FNR family transcriptional regulator, cyclic AMP receptor protein